MDSRTSRPATRSFRHGLLAGLAVLAAAATGYAQDLDTERFSYVTNAPSRPDFTLATVDGGSRSVSEWDGKVLLVDFWASWCIPCRKEMPAFNRLRAEYADRGFEVVGLGADSLDKVIEFLDEVPIDFPIVYGDLFDVMDISEAYGNTYGGLPFNAFVDRDGIIRYVQKPGEVTFEEAEEILLRLL